MTGTPTSESAVCLRSMRTVGPGRRILSTAVGRSLTDDVERNATLSDDQLRLHEKDRLARVLAEQFGSKATDIIFLKQVHGITAHRIETSDAARLYYGEGDALYTNRPGLLLTIRTADCLPLFFDYELREHEQGQSHNLVGVIHAGWRGLAAGIISKTLTRAFADFMQMVSQADAQARTASPEIAVRIWSGPCIGPQAYEVGADVADHFTRKQAQPDNTSGESKFLLDLPGNAELEVERAARQIEQSFPDRQINWHQDLPDFQGCTYLQNDRYYSHRRGDRGRNLNAIMIEE